MPRSDGSDLNRQLVQFRPHLKRMVTLRLDPRLRARLDASDGSLERLIRRPIPNPPISAAEANEYQESLRERMTRMSAMWRGLYEQVTLPETKPAYGRLLADTEGNLWVSAYDDEGTWTVFDAEGRLLGTMEIEGDVRVVEIGGDYLLGVWRDDLDVERVFLYGLLKP